METYVLWYLVGPIGKGSKTRCQDVLNEYVKKGKQAKHFMLLTWDEYQSMRFCK